LMALATLTQAGYSVRPLHEKLGYKPGSTIAFVSVPADLTELAGSVDFGKVARRQDWSRPLGPGTYDAIHAFTKSRAELAAGLPKLRRHLNSDGMIWISWPKKSSKVPTDVTEDVVRAEALKLDLVDVKVAAIDDVWSGLKLVVRVDRR
jgi:hypothetical protein